MSLRAMVRYAVPALGLGLAVNRLMSAWNMWVMWHRPDMQGDPSALELYETGFWVDLVSALLAGAVAAAWFWFLGPRRRPRPPV